MLGADLLVAPVVDEGATALEVYLPAGTWIDVWTGSSHDAGVLVADVSAASRIPVFARAEAWPNLKTAFPQPS
jgi:alpha-glucosidase (family GH31 glycosyl hydrolase)